MPPRGTPGAARSGTGATEPRARSGGRARTSRGDDRERAARRDRFGRVGGQQAYAVEEPVELVLGGPEADADPERIDQRQGAGDGEGARRELVEGGLRGPAVDPEGDQSGHPVPRREERDALDGRQEL